MKTIFCLFVIISAILPKSIIDFNNTSEVNKWKTVDDIVMGGTSSSTFELNSDGHGVFKGSISLENNGGFCSVRYTFQKKQIKGYKKAIIKLKGDGKIFQFRIKSNSQDYYSYINNFSTTGKWQEIVIPLEEMYPSFRGRRLNKPNFNSEYIEEVAFLIGNKKKENFILLIDNIYLK